MAPYNPPIAHYCHISVSKLPEESILKAIGKNGYYFKKITKECNASYIWWNKDNQVIEIWGDYGCMSNTKEKMIQHIKKIT